MNCKTCGFSASDPSITVCPFCKAGGQGGSAVMVAPAVWPPSPTVAPTYAESGYQTVENSQQRQAGILMAIIPLAIDQATSAFRNVLPDPYGSIALLIVILAGAYPHFRGCAHWAEAKGYPRYEGRLLGILGWLGVIFLAIRADKSKNSV